MVGDGFMLGVAECIGLAETVAADADPLAAMTPQAMCAPEFPAGWLTSSSGLASITRAVPSGWNTEFGSFRCNVIVFVKKAAVMVPSCPTVKFGRSPACGPFGFLTPCCLCVGLKCGPEDEKSGPSHRPTASMCTPCVPGGSLVIWNVTKTPIAVGAGVVLAVDAGDAAVVVAEPFGLGLWLVAALGPGDPVIEGSNMLRVPSARMAVPTGCPFASRSWTFWVVTPETVTPATEPLGDPAEDVDWAVHAAVASAMTRPADDSRAMETMNLTFPLAISGLYPAWLQLLLILLLGHSRLNKVVAHGSR